MIGVILAAGMAKRLRPLTDTKPKCLLEVGGKTLLQRTVDAMATAGINEFVVVTGYRGNMIRDFLTIHYPQFTIRFLDNVDYANNNNASPKSARPVDPRMLWVNRWALRR